MSSEKLTQFCILDITRPYNAAFSYQPEFPISTHLFSEARIAILNSEGKTAIDITVDPEGNLVVKSFHALTIHPIHSRKIIISHGN